MPGKQKVVIHGNIYGWDEWKIMAINLRRCRPMGSDDCRRTPFQDFVATNSEEEMFSTKWFPKVRWPTVNGRLARRALMNLFNYFNLQAFSMGWRALEKFPSRANTSTVNNYTLLQLTILIEPDPPNSQPTLHPIIDGQQLLLLFQTTSIGTIPLLVSAKAILSTPPIRHY